MYSRFFLTQKVYFYFLIPLIFSCARAPIKDSSEAMRISSEPPEISIDTPNLAKDLNQYLKSLKISHFPEEIHYSDQVWSKEELFHSYLALNEYLQTQPSEEFVLKYIKQHFHFLEVYGKKDWSEVFITSYFEPVYKGSRYKTKKYSSPALKLPKDLLQVRLTPFAQTHKQLRPTFDYILDGDKGPRSLTGRKVGNEILPYYSREEIVSQKKLNKKGLELVWLDPIDLFFLQIQGSATIQVRGRKEFTLGYAGQNGYEYVAVGKKLLDVIPLKEMTAGKIEEYLRSLPSKEREEILNSNPSYVFFEKRSGRPLTSMGTPVIDGRTIATDSYYFPKSLIGYMEVDHPDGGKIRRIVFNQDSGGAIKGPGRVDLFWGRGKDAGELAGKMKHPGKLWFLVPKKRSLTSF